MLKFFQTRERRAAFFMAFSASLALLAYELMRSSSYTLFKEAYGVSSLSYIFAVLPLVVTPILIAYNKSLSHFGPRQTFFLSIICSVFCIFTMWIAIVQGYKPATAILILVREMYIVVLVEQAWSFINSCLTEDEGRELNGPILAVISMGPIIGGFLVAWLSPLVGTTHLVALAALITCFPAILVARAYATFAPRAKEKKKTSVDASYGFQAFIKEKNLLLILCMIMATQVYATVIEIGFQMSLSDAYPSPDQQTSMSGQFFAWTHLSAFILQAIVAPILLKSLPVAILHIGIPFIHLFLLLGTFIQPCMATFAAAFFTFKAIDYSIFRAAKEVLYIPLSFDARYRAKEWIDVLAYRTSKGGTAFLLGSLQKIGLALPLYGFSSIGVVAVLTWLGSAFYMRSSNETQVRAARAAEIKAR